MAPTRAFTTPISTGERVTASQFNALDDGQYAALVRNGTAALTASSAITLGGFHFTVSGGGAGKFKPDADYTEFSGSGYPSLVTRTVTDFVPAVGPVFTTGEYTPTAQRFQQVSASKNLGFLLSLPIGTVVKSVTCYVKKGGGTAGLPGVMPGIELGYYTLSTDAFTQVGIVADATGTLVNYRLLHALTLGSLSHTIAAGRNYIVTLYGDDDSTNSSTGLYVYRPQITVEVTQLRAM